MDEGSCRRQRWGRGVARDAHGDASDAMITVVFQAQLGSWRVAERLDDLAEAAQLWCATSAGSLGACRTHELDA